jgi:hypothetical protein
VQKVFDPEAQTRRVAHPAVTNGLDLDYDPAGNNSFAGWGRFGRVVQQLWRDSTPVVKDQFKYGYDAAGNMEIAPKPGDEAEGKRCRTPPAAGRHECRPTAPRGVGHLFRGCYAASGVGRRGCCAASGGARGQAPRGICMEPAATAALWPSNCG